LLFIIGLILLIVAWRRRLARAIRVNQGPPLGFTLRLAHNCKVTGISQPQAKAAQADVLHHGRAARPSSFARNILAQRQRRSKIFRRVVHKSTGGILKPIPEPVDPVGNALLYVWW